MPLPLLISVPHAGIEIPPEVREDNLLTTEQIVRDGDEGAAVVYDIADEVAGYVRADMARAYVDLNRAETDRHADGVVKTHTIWQEPVYRHPLSPRTVNKLIQTYYRPYHQKLTALADTGVKLGVDCHTMAAVGPPIGPGPGVDRPPVCLSNAERTCPDEWLETLARCFEEAFGVTVAVNDPFKGGYIIRSHGHELPWVQVELSRSEFMSLKKKRECVLAAVERWCERHG